MKLATTIEVDANLNFVRVLSDPSVTFGEQRAKSFALAPTLPAGHKALFFDNPRIIVSTAGKHQHVGDHEEPHDKKRKGIFSKAHVAAVIMLLSCIPVIGADTVSWENFQHGFTTIPGGGTSNTTASAGIINRIKGPDVGIQITTHTDNATATNYVKLTWAKSVDGVNWSTAVDTWLIPSPSTNFYTFATNWTVAGLTAVKLQSVTYLSPTGTMTFDSFVYSIKKDSP